jgi:hypothetical protein
MPPLALRAARARAPVLLRIGPRRPARASAAARGAPRACAASVAGAPFGAGARRGAAVAPPELLEGYDATLAALCAEVDACGAGDALTLRSYVLESGASSAALLASLRGAAARGAAMQLAVDRSPLSALTRAYERTDTLAGELDELEASHPGFVSTAAAGGPPDHSKYLLVRRADPEACVAIFGGINIGGACARAQRAQQLVGRVWGGATAALGA